MTLTTIKVSAELRDRLKASAARTGRTMGEQIDALLMEEARRERFAAAREAMAQNPPDEEYLAELLAWQADAWS